MLPLAAALDFLRIALAPVLTSANERVMKLLHAGFSGLAPGLAARPDLGDDGYTEFGVAGQAIAAEARLLAAPVSFELVSSTQAEGIEDRMTMAPLAARRLAEMVALGERLVAIELVVAARAIDLRAGGPLGTRHRDRAPAGARSHTGHPRGGAGAVRPGAARRAGALRRHRRSASAAATGPVETRRGRAMRNTSADQAGSPRRTAASRS